MDLNSFDLASTFVVVNPDHSATPDPVTPALFDELDAKFDGFRAELLLDHGDRHAPHTLRDAGTYVIVPQGTWYTARTTVPTRMLFMTPGAGTENKPV